MNPRIVVAALSLSAVAFGGLVLHEGYSDRAIIPIPGDVPTIGFGTTEGVKMGDKITAPVAVQRSLRDVAKFEGVIKQCVKSPLHQHEYDAIVSFAYNIGPTAFCQSTLVAKLNNLDYVGACREMGKWVYVKGRRVRGLEVRRAGEMRLCLGDGR